MLTATIIAIFLIPVTFYVVERLTQRGREAGAVPEQLAPEESVGD
jgi:hypothetical protein